RGAGGGAVRAGGGAGVADDGDLRHLRRLHGAAVVVQRRRKPRGAVFVLRAVQPRRAGDGVAAPVAGVEPAWFCIHLVPRRGLGGAALRPRRLRHGAAVPAAVLRLLPGDPAAVPAAAAGARLRPHRRRAGVRHAAGGVPAAGAAAGGRTAAAGVVCGGAGGDLCAAVVADAAEATLARAGRGHGHAGGWLRDPRGAAGVLGQGHRLPVRAGRRRAHLAGAAAAAAAAAGDRRGAAGRRRAGVRVRLCLGQRGRGQHVRQRALPCGAAGRGGRPGKRLGVLARGAGGRGAGGVPVGRRLVAAGGAGGDRPPGVAGLGRARAGGAGGGNGLACGGGAPLRAGVGAGRDRRGDVRAGTGGGGRDG